MTAEATSPAPKSGSTAKRKAIVAGVGVVVLVVAYFVLAAFLPRWWSLRVADLATGTFHKGILWGLVFGVVCTLVPLLFFYSAWSGRKRRGAKFVAIVSVVLAVVTAIPNLLTLSIVLGGNNAAHAGERTLDTEAPGFRGATATGAIIAVVVFVLLAFVLVRAGRRRATKRAARSAPVTS
jgi:hypothetical protein